MNSNDGRAHLRDPKHRKCKYPACGARVWGNTRLYSRHDFVLMQELHGIGIMCGGCLNFLSLIELKETTL